MLSITTLTVLLIVAAFARATGAVPASGVLHVYGRFSDYCMYPMYTDKPGTSEALFDADCSSKKGGAYPGARLASSQLDLNDCFVNAGGRLIAQKGGGAMKSCSCDTGFQVCGADPDCPATTMQCKCRGRDGKTMVTGDKFDIGDHIGVVWSPQHEANLLVCTAFNGDTVAEYQGCTKLGVTTSSELCPS